MDLYASFNSFPKSSFLSKLDNFSSVLVGVGRGEVAEDGGGVTVGVLAAMEAGVVAVEKVASDSVGEESGIWDDGEAA